MGQLKKDPLTVEKLAENLATYAIDRNDLKEMLKTLPEDTGLNITTVEYELQILKILSVGWAISFYMPAGDNKKNVTRLFWEYIREISKNISNLTETTTGKAIDYFAILRQRLDDYVAAMQHHSSRVKDPSVIMGPVFANACKSPDNPIAILAGTKMFTLCLGGVKEYLDAVEIQTILS